MRNIAIALAVSLALASCTSVESRTQAAKAFDKVCLAEPPLYVSFMLLAEARGATAKTLARANAFHMTITNICKDPPTDIVSGLVTLTAVYAQFSVLQKQLK